MSDTCCKHPEKIAYSVREAASAVGVSDSTIYGLIAANEIAARKLGTKYLIPSAELEAWFTSLPEA